MTSTTSEGFQEEDIRPAHLMDEATKAMFADIARLLTRRAEFVRVLCPACNSHESRPLFSKNGFDYEHCSNCDTFYVNPRPSPAVLDWFYRDSTTYAYWNAQVFPAAEEARRRLIVAPRVDAILDLCDRFDIPTESILEIGAAFGTFCLEVASRQRFSRIVAIEPTPELAQTCRARGLDTVEKPFETYAATAVDEGFSVIANFEVLEHLFSPRQFLQSIYRMLNPGGLMVLTCPNGQGFDIQVLGQLSESVDHEHLNYFSPPSLHRLLADCGFEVVDLRTPGRLDAELVRKKALSGEFNLSAQAFLKRVLVDEWDRLGGPFQNFLVQQGLSSNMWVAARKQQ
jgi:2-polyprenyl-3-methyl-5-hydroxy-6-metoxy-1,4-benzoquinol methylase